MSTEYKSKDELIFKEVIGEGAYGRALLCKSKRNGELVVIKEIALSNLTAQEQKDAYKEVKILSTLHHPNIISYKGSFVADNILNIVMEYADNGDLFGQIQNANGQHFKEDQILDWFVQICLALKHIHDRKILHRDIKCQNVFLTKNGVVKMGDFGIAKVLDHTTQLSKTAIGTPYYLSPEICQGKNYNQKSDIWSLGCVLYEICTLQHAFDSNCMNGLIMKILRSKHSPIPSFYSPDLRNLVDVLLQKDPKKRPRIHQILNYDFIRKRISNLLDTTLLKIEFSHTVIHNPKSNSDANNNNTNNNENDSSNKNDELEKYQDNVPAIREEHHSSNKIGNRTRSTDTISKHQKHTNPSEQSMTKAEAILAQKNASVRAERAAQKELKQKKEAEEKREKEKYEKKRQEVEENSKKRSKEREQFLQHQREYKEMQKNFENMDAPFKSVKGNISNSTSNKSGVLKKPAPGCQKRSPSKISAEANSTKKPDMEGTRRPGLPPRAVEEQENLRALMAKRRAELKKQKSESDDVIQIGKVEIKIGSSNNSTEKVSTPKSKQEEKEKPSPLSSPKPKQEEKSSSSQTPKHKQEEKSSSNQTPKPKQDKEKSNSKKIETSNNNKDDDSDDENVADMIKFSDSDYDSEDDFHSLASMCKQILDQPVPLNESKKINKTTVDTAKKTKTSKRAEPIANSDGLLFNDSDDDSEDDSTPAEPGVFYFGGKEIKLPSVTDRDSLSYRVEAIRQFIEKGLGLDKFIEVYRFIVVESDEMNEIDANKKIHEILSTPDELSYYKLIQQLVVCEETLNEG